MKFANTWARTERRVLQQKVCGGTILPKLMQRQDSRRTQAPETAVAKEATARRLREQTAAFVIHLSHRKKLSRISHMLSRAAHQESEASSIAGREQHRTQ